MYNHIEDSDDLLLLADEDGVWEKINRNQMQNFRLKLTGKPWRPVNWVTDSQTFESLISGLTPTEATANVVNQLGLDSPKESEKYIYLKYSEGFCTISYQPCCVNSEWDSDGLYLSFQTDDDYGRTVPRDGIAVEVLCRKERVHLNLEEAAEFSAHTLGAAYFQPVNKNTIESEILSRI